MLWNYFVSELRLSASQNLSKKDGAVKTATFFSEKFCQADWRKFRNKEAARRPPWLTDGIDGHGLCTLIFSVAEVFSLSFHSGGLAGALGPVDLASQVSGVGNFLRQVDR